MQSPFPGMDPYLENRAIFPDFHDRFIAYLSEAIQPGLPEPYYAALGRRAWVEVTAQKRGQEPIAKWPAGCSALLVPDPFFEPLVEIDFLRGGTHTTAVPEDRLKQKVPNFTYHVCSHHFDHFEDFLIYPIQLADALPTISIPLLPGDGEVPVNLQQVFERTYAAGPYHREIDYSETIPLPELTPDQMQWVKERLGR